VSRSATSPDAVGQRPHADSAILRVEGLSVQYSGSRGTVRAVDDVSFVLERGEVFGLVGESGCGKSATLRALIGLLPKGTTIDGTIEYEGREPATSERQLRAIRGRGVSLISQDPMTALNPVLRIHEQIDEALSRHTTLSRAKRRDRAIALMRLVGIPAAERRLGEYPHQFSGGMRQRILIAIALACEPRVLLADEPTTALDVTVQDQILQLLRGLQRRLGMSMILVSHDLGVIAQMCDRVAVMYAGQIVELGATSDVIRAPRHPYTRALLASVLDVERESQELVSIPGLPPVVSGRWPTCRFYDRCALRTDACRTWETRLLAASGQLVRCWRQDD
jgi:peptide/nickel transport system ATP-binding protein